MSRPPFQDLLDRPRADPELSYSGSHEGCNAVRVELRAQVHDGLRRSGSWRFTTPQSIRPDEPPAWVAVDPPVGAHEDVHLRGLNARESLHERRRRQPQDSAPATQQDAGPCVLKPLCGSSAVDAASDGPQHIVTKQPFDDAWADTEAHHLRAREHICLANSQRQELVGE